MTDHDALEPVEPAPATLDLGTPDLTTPDLATVEPVEVEPVEVEPISAEAEPIAADAVEDEPIAKEYTDVEFVAAEPPPDLAADPATAEPVATEHAEPQSSAAESVELEVIEPSSPEPETAEPSVLEPVAWAEPNAIEPETVEPETVEPETVEPETVEPETVEPEAIEPEAIEPETIPEAIVTAEPALPKVGKVYLVGSGPGQVDHLTVKAHRLLTQAEVVIYDALVDRELLAIVPATCQQVNVGKRGGQPSIPQSAINDLLVQHCLRGDQVVRLKSGDPFIFGRSQSEIAALRAAGCDFEIIPGLSSALAAPVFAGIPLTDPAWSRYFTVLSAHDPEALDWPTLAQIDTLVILMGGRTLPAIIDQLRQCRKSAKTPIAIIRWAGHPQEQTWIGTLGTILKQTANERLSPCVIVIGDVVQLREKMQPPEPPAVVLPAQVEPEISRQPQGSPNPSSPPAPRSLAAAIVSDVPANLPANLPASLPAIASVNVAPSAPMSTSPLAGKTVLVTRAANQSSQFSDRLQDCNAVVIDMPALEIVPPSSWEDLDDAIAQLDDFDWLVLTSSNAVDYFFERLQVQNLEVADLDRIRIAVVGDKTARVLAQWGREPDFVPPAFVADSLAEHFPGNLDGAQVLFARVESGGRDALVKDLTAKGASVTEVAAYQSACPRAIAPAALAALQNQRVDIITFASSKTVKHFCQLLERAQPDASWQAWLERVCIASIGPQTSHACKTLLGRVDAEAQEYTLDGLIVAIEQWLKRFA